MVLSTQGPLVSERSGWRLGLAVHGSFRCWVQLGLYADKQVSLRHSGQHLAQFLQGAAHLRLDGADRAVGQLGDLFVGQLAVLPQQEDFFFFRPQVQQGLAQPLEGFRSSRSRAGRRCSSTFGMTSAPSRA